ncbi:hypothetical protein KZZ52_02270 [Dactylosporangium sp. AC04546]|uniref:hypothetical protein n=1 Tax=Dactylosporangium sp. AC04546 TaxID=2862460 RepID=UPI001EE0A0EB|nr:hypothetical protein [Dactylosporangium sp. AC04546]WVK84284.1 hypothetical protein KZZ52_02270 [Dactylosporangium sp. AC04546]
MADDAEELERQIEPLRVRMREAAAAGDRPQVAMLKAELRALEEAWYDALEAMTPDDGQPAGSRLVPLREQVHSALTLLAVPAAPKLVAQVYNACYGGDMRGEKLTSLRRDEERSFRTAPFARPYYLCAALTADRLAPVRGLLAVSTWELEQRIVGALSPRVDFLTAAVNIARHAERVEVDRATARLLWLFAENIPGAADGIGSTKPAAVIRAAESELTTHAATDRSHREAAAARARTQLDDAGRLFGSTLKPVEETQR